MGVQFSPPQGYQQILAGEVWKLFREKYPKVQEQQALLPSFETFGPSPQFAMSSFPINFVNGALHDRFWFLKLEGDELIQFQQDRLLHNWRKVNDKINEYPRFERMIESFKVELEQFQTYCNSLAPQTLAINQCEISYINHIDIPSEDPRSASEWLRLLDMSMLTPEGFSFVTREILKGVNGEPQGRLTVEAVFFKPENKKIIALTLTVKGAPGGTDINSAVDFLTNSRNLICNRFTQITTEAAHKKWGKI